MHATLGSKKKMLLTGKKERTIFVIWLERLKKKKDVGLCYSCFWGKDSTWQVVKALEYGLKPLCVTWKTPARGSLGQKNLDNLVNLGIDHVDFSINPDVEKRFTFKALSEKGSVAIPMHMAIFAIPLRIANNFKIPLVLWGENSGLEYGSCSMKTLGLK